ncbi:MAG: response regulator transcription factor [Dehalococcoidia bacterium]
MADVIKVLIADDHPVVRFGLSALLRGQAGMDVVGEAGDGATAVEMARQFRPDVILMDLQMPVMGGVEAIKVIRREISEARIIILTTFHTDEHIFSGLEAGACSYLLKDASSFEVADAVLAAHRGESTIEPRVASRILNRFHSGNAVKAKEERLSAREIEVLKLVAQGATNKGVAGQLFITENTVRAHLNHIFEKLGVNDRTHAVTEAARMGIIDI